MKNQLVIVLALFAMFIYACSNDTGKTAKQQLSAQEFKEKINQSTGAPIVDVRTPEEFSNGHLQNARNIDWNGDDFDAQIKQLDKEKPVLVYCKSGGRSSSAAAKMRADGFKEVYELNGGIMRWEEAGLPVETKNDTTNTSSSGGMNRSQFDSLIGINKMVLVDFYADWCAPCKKIAPYLEELQRENADKVLIVRINSDDNDALTKELKVYGLPTLQLYKNKMLAWTNTGYISKEDVAKQLR